MRRRDEDKAEMELTEWVLGPISYRSIGPLTLLTIWDTPIYKRVGSLAVAFGGLYRRIDKRVFVLGLSFGVGYKWKHRRLARLAAICLRSPWRVCPQCNQGFAEFEEGKYGTALTADGVGDVDRPTCAAESCQAGARRSQEVRWALLRDDVVPAVEMRAGTV